MKKAALAVFEIRPHARRRPRRAEVLPPPPPPRAPLASPRVPGPPLRAWSVYTLGWGSGLPSTLYAGRSARSFSSAAIFLRTSLLAPSPASRRASIDARETSTPSASPMAGSVARACCRSAPARIARSRERRRGRWRRSASVRPNACSKSRTTSSTDGATGSRCVPRHLAVLLGSRLLRAGRLGERRASRGRSGRGPVSRVRRRPRPRPRRTRGIAPRPSPGGSRTARGGRTSSSHSGRGLEPGGRAVAAPRPVARGRHHAGPDRVPDDVAGDLEEVGLALDEDRLEAPLEDVSVAPVTPVEVLRVVAVELPHPARERRLGRPHQEVVVVPHEDPRVELPAEELDGPAEESQELAPVLVVDGRPRAARFRGR